MSDEKKNLYQRILAIMADVEYLQKDDKVSYSTTNYKAISEEKVTTTIRVAMIKHGVVILPIGVELKKEGSLSSVQAKYKIVNTDDPKEFEIIESCGQGADTQDKGSGKAMTYAYKYMLLRTFAIATGEDPDRISSDELDDKDKKAAEAAKKADAAKKAAEDKKAAEEKKTTEGKKSDDKTANADTKNTGKTDDSKKTGQTTNTDSKALYFAGIEEVGLKAKEFISIFGTPNNAAQMEELFKKPTGSQVTIFDSIIGFYKIVKNLIKDQKDGVSGFIQVLKINVDSIPELMKEPKKLEGQVKYYLQNLKK